MPHEPGCVLEEYTQQKVHRMVDRHLVMPPLTPSSLDLHENILFGGSRAMLYTYDQIHRGK